MFESLPQFVDQEYCLSCRGCCHFDTSKSDWRPKWSMSERNHHLSFVKVKNSEVSSPLNVDAKGFIQTRPSDKSKHCRHHCYHLESSSHHCQIYNQRPFDCQLYPFLLRKKNNKRYISVHQACPFVIDHAEDERITAYTKILLEYLQREDIRKFLSWNDEIFHEYSSYDGEITDLEELILDENTTADLLNQRETFEQYINFSRANLSSHHFSSLFSWKDFYDFQFEITDGCLYVTAKDDLGSYLYLPPLGKDLTDELVADTLIKLKSKNGGHNIGRIENVGLHQLRHISGNVFKIYQKGYEYVYVRNDIAALKGNIYKSKRSAYNQFIKSTNPVFRSFDAADVEPCLKLYERWSRSRTEKYVDEIFDQAVKENLKVHRRAIKYSRELGLIGRVVEIDGMIAAYTFGYRLTESVFSVLFEVVDLTYKGLATYIFTELCRDSLLSRYQFINAMDDAGFENIKQTKLSFHPSVLLPVYTVSLKDEL